MVFLNDAAVSDRKVAEAMQLAMSEMFPEADSSCYTDVSKLYFGGRFHFVPNKNESVYKKD